MVFCVSKARNRWELFSVPKAGHAFSTGEGSNRLLRCVWFSEVLAGSAIMYEGAKSMLKSNKE